MLGLDLVAGYVPEPIQIGLPPWRSRLHVLRVAFHTESAKKHMVMIAI